MSAFTHPISHQPAPHPADTRAITDLIPDLTGLARYLARNRSDAQDLVQETLLRLLRHPDKLMQIDDLSGYARTILRNLHRRQMGQPVTHSLDDAPEPGAPPAVFPALALQEMLTAIATLPPEQVALLHLVLEGDTSPRDLATRTGLPMGTVMSRLARARAQLRRDFGLRPDEPISALF